MKVDELLNEVGQLLNNHRYLTVAALGIAMVTYHHLQPQPITPPTPTKQIGTIAQNCVVHNG
jgi:hypothetical protein